MTKVLICIEFYYIGVTQIERKKMFVHVVQLMCEKQYWYHWFSSLVTTFFTHLVMLLVVDTEEQITNNLYFCLFVTPGPREFNVHRSLYYLV